VGMPLSGSIDSLLAPLLLTALCNCFSFLFSLSFGF
jgi:hypothetical protein